VRKPAGWDLFTSDEVFEDETLWTGIRYDGRPVGLKIQSSGTLMRPKVIVGVYSGREISKGDTERLHGTLAVCLGADQDLKEFYEFAKNDGILKHVVESLNGMHDTQGVSLFNSVILSICLQMARLKRSMEMMEAIDRSYGETIQFDGKKVVLQPTAVLHDFVKSENVAK
jgi:3-methyladenine DNA glycosylase/8-oxoguanine DNA glycosylase